MSKDNYTIDNYAVCYKCGVKEYGEPPKEDMLGITVWEGTCPVCKKEKVTLVPRIDFQGRGD